MPRLPAADATPVTAAQTWGATRPAGRGEPQKRRREILTRRCGQPGPHDRPASPCRRFALRPRSDRQARAARRRRPGCNIAAEPHRDGTAVRLAGTILRFLQAKTSRSLIDRTFSQHVIAAACSVAERLTRVKFELFGEHGVDAEVVRIAARRRPAWRRSPRLQRHGS